MSILYPKLTKNFTVKFFEVDGDKQIFLELTDQIVNFNPSEIIFDDHLSTDNNNVYFVFEDDASNSAAKVIFGKRDFSDFDMVLEVLDGDRNVLEKIKYKSSSFKSCYHNEPFDYSSSLDNKPIQAQFNPPSIIGNAVEEAPGGVALLKALECFFKNMSVSIWSDHKISDAAVVKRTVRVEFVSQETIFCDRQA